MNKSYKRFLAASVAGMVVTSVAAPIMPVNVLSAEAASTGFTDVYKENYFFEAVANLTQRGVIKGFNDNTYRPNEEVTRAQAAAIIAASLGLNTKTAKDPGFKDVKAGVWYHGAVASLVENKIMSGIDSNTFLPNKPVTRAEMAKMLSLAYNLKSSAAKTAFADVPEKSWFASFVGALVENKVTSGMDAKTFAPGQTVTRGQMAAFVYRAEKTVVSTLIVEKVSASTVTISGKAYNLSDTAKSIFNPANEAALKNALVRFEESKGTITKLTYLEINASGTSAGDVVFDGNNASIDGSVKINGDYVTVKNLTVTGSFELGAGVQKSFYSNHLTVEGKTIVGAAAAVKASSSDTAFYKGLTQKVSLASLKAAAVAKMSKIVFDNANLKSVDVNKKDVLVESTGSSTIGEITLTSNAAINATDGVVIPKITVSGGAEAVEINAKVTELAVNSTKPLTLSGSATIDNVKIQQSAAVNLNTTGEIKQIQSQNKDTKLTISETAKVGNIEVPAGTNVSEVVTNYDQVKENIENVGGQTNPDAAQPTPPPSTEPAPPPVNEEDVKAVTDAKAALVEASLLNGNESLETVTGDLTLPAAGAEGTVITWTSSNQNVVAVDGKVVRPAYNEADATVTLTARISKNGVSQTKAFTVIVKKKVQTAAEAVDAAKAALFDGELLNGNQGLSAVTGDLTLPAAGIDGTTIAWTSSNPAVVSAEGKVTRPAYTAADAEVTLTATISKDGVSDTKTFAIVVKKMIQTDAEAVSAAKAGLVDATLLNGNESLDAVTGDLTLPVNGMDGTVISWSSSDLEVVSNDGKVTQPAYTENDAEVTLTATISKNGVSDTKTFGVVVKKKIQTDAEAVAADLAALVDETILYNNESLDNVTGELALPLEGINGTMITWTSSNTDVVTEDGIVKRPAHTEEDVEVTLTATVSKNAGSDTKTFTVIVKKEDQPAEPVVKTIELYNGLSTLVSKYDLFPTNPELFTLNITKVESSDPAVLTATVHNIENINLTPVANGSATITVTLSNGETAEFPVIVSNLELTLDSLNGIEIDSNTNNQYKYKAAQKIIESLIDTDANSDYASSYDYLKEKMMQWVLKKRPEAGFASTAELTSTLEMVASTVVELEAEYQKYVYGMDLFSNLEVDENGKEIARDVTSKLLREPANGVNPSINRTFNIVPFYDQERFIEERDGKVLHVKNNTTDMSIQDSFFYDLEKNGITRTGRITVKIAPQSAVIPAPEVLIQNGGMGSYQVSKTHQPIYVEVRSGYQLDELTAEQNGSAVPISYVSGGNYGQPARYEILLNEVKGADQELKVTAKVGDQTTVQTITLTDMVSPIVYSVEKDVAKSQFVVTFSEPVENRSPEADMTAYFKVGQGSVISATQTDDTTFVVKVTDIETDYLQILPDEVFGGIIEANDRWLYLGNDVFIFNNTSAVLQKFPTKLEELSTTGGVKHQGLYIVEGNKFSYESVERPQSFGSISLYPDTYNVDEKDKMMAALDRKVKENADTLKDFEYLGLEGYFANDHLNEYYLEGGGSEISITRYINTYAKYKTKSDDIVYSRIFSDATLTTNKELALDVVNNLFNEIPSDHTAYEEDDLKSYQESLEQQIELLKKLNVSDVEVQQLSNYSKFTALLDYLNSL